MSETINEIRYDILLSLHANVIGNLENLKNLSGIYSYSGFVISNSCFISFDNNIKYINEAISKGAKVIICTYRQSISITQIIVSDILRFLKNYAIKIRSEYVNPVIGVLGSCGKTTIKTFLSQALPGKILYTRRSYNVIASICQELLFLNNKYDYCVIEMGTSAPGEIDDIGRIISPDYCIYGAIGLEHIEFFENLENVCKEEASISRYVKKLSIGPEILAPYFETNKYISVPENDTNLPQIQTLLKILNISSDCDFILPNHRGNYIYALNQKIYDYSFNCNILSFLHMIRDITSRNEKCDLILGNLAELGEQRDIILESVVHQINNCDLIDKVYIFNINLESSKCTELNLDTLILNKTLYVQGSRSNNLTEVVCRIFDKIQGRSANNIYKIL